MNGGTIGKAKSRLPVTSITLLSNYVDMDGRNATLGNKISDLYSPSASPSSNLHADYYKEAAAELL